MPAAVPWLRFLSVVKSTRGLDDGLCLIAGMGSTKTILVELPIWPTRSQAVGILVAVSELLKLLKLLGAGDSLSTWQEDMALSFRIVVKSGLALCRGVGCSSDACCVIAASSALGCINLSKMSIRAFWDL